MQCIKKEKKHTKGLKTCLHLEPFLSLGATSMRPAFTLVRWHTRLGHLWMRPVRFRRGWFKVQDKGSRTIGGWVWTSILSQQGHMMNQMILDFNELREAWIISFPHRAHCPTFCLFFWPRLVSSFYIKALHYLLTECLRGFKVNERKRRRKSEYYGRFLIF